MADNDDDDDDFEDLFSFGASTPGAAPPSSSEPTKEAPTSSGSNNDFDTLSDVSLSTTPGGAAPAAGPDGGDGPPLAAGDNNAARTLGRSSSGVGSGGGADEEFDALFGTPPPTPATPRTPLGLSSEDKDALLAVVETPDATAEMSSMDDFHVHDEDTRDMLDWLDDDVPAGKDAKQQNNDKINQAEVDDFDFDQMIAESQSGESTKEKTQEKPLLESGTASLDVSKKDGNSSDTDSIPIQRVSSNIEEELALDQWEDDDENEQDMEDLQRPIDAKNTQDETLPGDVKMSPAGTEKVPSPRIKFASLSEAIRSNASMLENVQQLFRREKELNNVNGDKGVGEEDRAHLWTKVICGKVLKDMEDGSLADSYREWEKKTDSAAAKLRGEEYGTAIDSLLKDACGVDSDDVVPGAEEKRQLLSLSYYHSSRGRDSSKIESYSPRPDDVDPLIPPVALAVLRAGIPPAAASVVMSQIEPSAMPLLRLSNEERYLATKALHADFYLLACYHLPLLVMHLDRHCPGWYWPRKGGMGQCLEDENPVVDDNGAVTNNAKKEGRQEGGDGSAKGQAEHEEEKEGPPSGVEKSKLEENGLVPLSWFVTIFAGECGASCLNHKHLLPLWDNVLTKGDYSWKYFLAIAILEKNSDVLLMSRGEELKQGLEKILDFQQISFADESFVGSSEGAAATADASTGDGMISEWLLSAKSLMESTPASVTELLRSADDRAVAGALKARRTQVEKELQAQLDADEASRRKEREEREREEERALNEARLTAYYRTYNPEKIDTIPKILKLFDGRMGVLNEKLKNKYGKGFLPDEDLKDQTRSFFMSVNQSITETRKHVSVAVSERMKKNAKPTPDESRSKTTPVALEVSTTEVIPMICTTKAHNLATGKKLAPARRTSDTVEALQFYLVDCRPESIAAEQGRFPTAVTLSPEKLQDPDELQKLTDMFESLRGAVHICVMGEGFASFPVLYNHTLSKVEEKLLQDDLARTGDCALFFLKKGFPFVSVLRGGFAAAHAFLSRNGPPMGMSPPEVLVDYDPVVSLFAQLETARQEEEEYKNAPAREKTARTLQKIIDNSMTRLTLEEQRINNLANDLAKPETVVKMKQSVSNFLAKPKTVPSIGFGRTPPLFMSKKFSATKEEESEKEIESTQEDEKAKPTAASFTEKINLKMVSLDSDLSTTALSDNDEKDNDNVTESEASPKLGVSTTEGKVNALKDSGGSKTSFAKFASRIKQVTVAEVSEDGNPAPEVSLETALSSDRENGGGCASDNPSKVSSAFASLTQRIHQSTATINPENAPPNSEGETKEGTVSKLSFSGFTNRIKLGQRSADQQTTLSESAAKDRVTEEEDHFPGTSKGKDKETEDDSSDKSPTDEGRFTKLTKSIGGTFAGLRETSLEAKVPEEAEDSIPENIEEKELKTGKPTEIYTDGGRFTKFTKSFGGTIAGLRETAANAKVSVEKEDSIPHKSQENDMKADSSTDDLADGGRFTKFTKSFGGTLAGLREPAADDKVLEETEDSIPKKSEDEEVKTGASSDNPSDEGRFTKFTKSFGGLGLLQSKTDSANPKNSSEAEEPGPMTRRISDLGKSSMGKLLFENEPLPKTRFQRMDAEESISFDKDDDSPKTSNTDSQDDAFFDVSLTDISLTGGDGKVKGDVNEETVEKKNPGDGEV